MDIKIGSLTNAFMFDPLETALESLAKAGFRHVEIMCDRPHMYPGDFDYAARMRIKALCERLGITIEVLEAIHVMYSTVGLTPPEGPFTGRLFYPNPNGNEPMFTCIDPAMRQARIDYIKQVIDMAVDLGVKKVETYNGKITADPDTCYELALEGVRECVEYAAARGVTLLLETSDVEEIFDYAEKINSPYLKFSLDIGHLEVERKNIYDTIRFLRHHIGNMHVDDIRRHQHYHMPIGRGDIHWEKVFATIKEIGYTDAVCLEIYPYALDPMPAVTESFQYLTKIVDSL